MTTQRARAILATGLFAALLIATAADALGQEGGRAALSPGLAYRDTVLVGTSDSIALSAQFLRLGPFLTLVEGDRPLRDSLDFTADRRTGIVRLTPAFLASLPAGTPQRIAISYSGLPLRLPPSFRLRELVTRRDSARGDTIRVAVASAPMTVDNFFGAGLTKSGYIGRGFTVGTNKDLSLNSGFRLQLSGKLAEDIDLVAALTDENTPIQPEGNTRTLQELDKVFIKLSSPFASATLGDFTLSYGGTEFGRYTRKLSGVLAEATLDAGSVSASYASLKGSFRSMQFNGIDGMQGPYRLTGRNGEPRIIVLAGTERVYVDGVEMIRGETNDYVIEYASGELYFRPRRMMTSASRITVDFEYTDRQYVRSLFTANGNGSFFSKRLNVTARYIREGDDPDSPIDAQLGDADRAALAAAGDDQSKAAVSGVTYVGIDSARFTGAGQYVRVDSSIGGSAYRYYRYDPGADSATYTVSFSYVGAGKGDYTRKTLGLFAFAGVNGGDYAPVRLLAMPQLQQLADVLVEANPLKDLRLFAEASASDLARNRFSTLDAGDNGGSAVNAGGAWKQSLGALGEAEVSGRFRATTATFSPIDRINDIEFSRKWDINAPALATETIREGALAWRPSAALRINGGAGSYTRGLFSSQRLEGGLSYARDTALAWLPALSYAFEAIGSDDGAALARGDWFRQRGEARYDWKDAQPYLRFESEKRTSRSGTLDTLTSNTLAFRDLRPGVLFPAFWNMSLAVDLGFRSEDAYLGGALRHQSDDVYQQFTWSLRPWNDLSASSAITIRNRSYAEAFRLAGNKDLQTILTKSQVQYAPLKRAVATDLLYEVSTEKTSRLERVFLKVPYGQGNYVYKGDANGNGVADESEFEPTRFDGEYVLITVPTDALFPVIDLRSSARLQLKPARIINAGASGLGAVLRALSTESVVRVEEKSSNERTSDVYLLRFSTFLNDSTTLRGFQSMRQDVMLWEQEQDLSLRLRFEQARGFSQYALANERSYKRERSLRLRAQPMTEIGFQGDLAFTNDDVASTTSSNRARAIDATTFTGDFSYRPQQRVEVGFVLSLKSAVNSYTAAPVEASIATQALRSTVSFDGPGRLRLEIERSEVKLTATSDIIPYELTDGKPEGQSWVIRFNLDYRITSFLQATTSYVGRTEGSPKLLNTIRAEVRAFF